MPKMRFRWIQSGCPLQKRGRLFEKTSQEGLFEERGSPGAEGSGGGEVRGSGRDCEA